MFHYYLEDNLSQETVMYAIISDGGRQYKVEEGQILDIDLREASVGDQLTFDRVLAFRDDEGLKIGRPVLESAGVQAEIVAVAQGPKLVVQKFRRRKNSRRKTGHRQLFTQVKINKIEIG
jgi:large subunit ribosomal protein L21